jgi:hydroxymethylpyrimidine pyrophosphatase-like HAD family hydrolase
MINWVFDVDGVLSNVGVPAPEAFKDWFLNWSQGRTYYLISGGRREKTIYQVGADIVAGAQAVYCCIGNSRWQSETETCVNQFELTDQELAWFQQQIDQSGCPEKTGWHLDFRNGSLNFSTVGRNANIEQRERYKQWEQQVQERQRLAAELTDRFPRFECYVGGDTSIDICLRGANKGQCVPLIRQQTPGAIYFFGDRCFAGGIDEPFAGSCTATGDRVYEVTGYQHTWAILESLSKIDYDCGN